MKIKKINCKGKIKVYFSLILSIIMDHFLEFGILSLIWYRLLVQVFNDES